MSANSSAVMVPALTPPMVTSEAKRLSVGSPRQTLPLHASARSLTEKDDRIAGDWRTKVPLSGLAHMGQQQRRSDIGVALDLKKKATLSSQALLRFVVTVKQTLHPLQARDARVRALWTSQRCQTHQSAWCTAEYDKEGALASSLSPELEA